ncbi:helix-turn-helix domain-containing protein [Rhodopirellula sp. JC639]|uniref:helix-turn-helix domain-containing protein n=1 Tax=Stieleria mannarensis TaxID=2755585 RepID=UPI0015FFD6E8|nr:helix-turn-helix domain-containing protein [Rhodopirellula sp. JC639]
MRITKLHTLEEAAKFLREHKESVRQKVKAGIIRGVATGNGTKRCKWLVPDESLQQYIADRLAASQPKPKRKSAPASAPKEWV